MTTSPRRNDPPHVHYFGAALPLERHERLLHVGVCSKCALKFFRETLWTFEEPREVAPLQRRREHQVQGRRRRHDESVCAKRDGHSWQPTLYRGLAVAGPQAGTHLLRRAVCGHADERPCQRRQLRRRCSGDVSVGATLRADADSDAAAEWGGHLVIVHEVADGGEAQDDDVRRHSAILNAQSAAEHVRAHHVLERVYQADVANDGRLVCGIPGAGAQAVLELWPVLFVDETDKGFVDRAVQVGLPQQKRGQLPVAHGHM
eukprot:CAMPEP_0204119584 /NCGR_PEP_ID=MMETSP0361-20130328/7189_1 /ASSEMBLY_ACC=CAM_ASM_000343 /TAXON_ID=268821 /ORGANISM="Scrippsiella Hangoei, Strain SHTV-5" /LENGTH=259 /DNA_ID=CAMNT_0051070731 /DNA_START=140 /DNA_END=920 /DNA_ORIENTATION=-